MIEAILGYTFMQHALIGAVLASVVCGIIGTLITEKRLLMLAGGISHTAFGGIGLGYYLGIEPIYGALGITLAASWAIPTVSRRVQTNTDILIALFWSLGMALGILFVALTPGYPPDMASYLFGNILTISRSDLRLMLLLTGTIVLFIAAFYHVYEAYLLDEEYAKQRGVPMIWFEYLLYGLTALTVVVLIRVVGIILVLALLAAPPAIAKMFLMGLQRIMVAASILGIVFNLIGLWASYHYNIPSGAAIILSASLGYFFLFAVRIVRER